MTSRPILIAIIAAALITTQLGGCAKSRLVVHVDVWTGPNDGDVELTREKVLEYRRAIGDVSARVRNAVKALRRVIGPQRTALDKQLIDAVGELSKIEEIEKQAHRRALNAKNEIVRLHKIDLDLQSEIERLRANPPGEEAKQASHQERIRTSEQRLGELQPQRRAAKHTSEQAQAELNDVQKQRKAAEQVKAAVDLTRDTAMIYESNLHKFLDSILKHENKIDAFIESWQATLDQVTLAESNDLPTRFENEQAFQLATTRLSAAGIEFIEFLLREVDPNQPVRKYLNRNLNDKFDTDASRQLDSIFDSLEDGLPSLAAVPRRLAADFAVSANPDLSADDGDPMYRRIVAMTPDGRWYENLFQQAAQADGRTEFVIVRETPVRYTLYEASANPAVLIRSQLRLARAGLETISGIARGATGLPIGQLFGGSPEANGNDDGQTSSEKEQMRIARIVQAPAARRDAEAVLRSIRLSGSDRIKSLDDDEPNSRAADYDPSEHSNYFTSTIAPRLRAIATQLRAVFSAPSAQAEGD